MADLNTINADIDALDSENNTQAAKIAEAMSLLSTKAAGGKNEPLTFSGAVSAVYDGSEPVSVEIPQGGGGDEWEFIGSFSCEEDALSLQIDFGKPLKKFWLKSAGTASKLYSANATGNNYFRVGATRTLYNTEYFAGSANANFGYTTWAAYKIFVDLTIADRAFSWMAEGNNTSNGSVGDFTNNKGKTASGCFLGAGNNSSTGFMAARTWEVYGVPA